MTKYKAMIGIEMHCEISETNTKVFSAARNSYPDKPNTNINAINIFTNISIFHSSSPT